MIPTLATVTLGGGLPEKIAAAANAGFAAIEVFDADLTSSRLTPQEAVRRCKDSGLELLEYFPLRDCEGMPPDLRAETFDRCVRFMDLAAELGAKMIMACSNVHPASLADPNRIADDLGALGDLARKRGLSLAYEAIAWGRHVDDYRQCWDLIRDVDHPNVGLVLDTFHICARKADVAPIRDIPRDKIFLVQISDAPQLDLDFMSWSRSHRTLPGRGDFDLANFARALRATGYDGVFSLECFSDQLKSEPTEGVANDGYRLLLELWREGAEAPPGHHVRS